MPWISQSSLLPMSPEKVLASLSIPPSLAIASGEKATLHYVFPEEIVEGALVEYKILCGVEKITWLAPITMVKDEFIHTDLDDHSLFQYFSANHFVRTFNGQSILRDEFEYKSNGVHLDEWMNHCGVQHSFSSRMTMQQRQTTQFRSLGEESA